LNHYINKRKLGKLPLPNIISVDTCISVSKGRKDTFTISSNILSALIGYLQIFFYNEKTSISYDTTWYLLIICQAASPGNNEGPFLTSSQAATCYISQS